MTNKEQLSNNKTNEDNNKICMAINMERYTDKLDITESMTYINN